MDSYDLIRDQLKSSLVRHFCNYKYDNPVEKANEYIEILENSNNFEQEVLKLILIFNIKL